MVVALAAIPLPPGPEHTPAVVAAAVLSAATAAAVVFLPWDRLPRVADVAPPLAFLVCAGLLRHGEGGGESSYAPLLILPVAWMAAYGTRVQLGVVLAALAAVMTLPILVYGAPEYPDGEWRRTFVWVATSAVLGFAGQRLMEEGRRQARITQVD